MTFAAMPCIADHEFPHIPDRVLAGLRGAFWNCALVPLTNEDDGSEVTLRRDLGPAPEFDVGVGDPFLDVMADPPLLAASSLPSPAYMSSSTDISLRVLGRNVELLLDVDSEAPLAGFMACAHQAGQVKLELHTPDNWSGRVDAWHVTTWT
jgi:hypothetical protein